MENNKDKHKCNCVKVNGVECVECKCSDKKSKESELTNDENIENKDIIK